MFASAMKSADLYNKVEIETGVTSANPHKLVLMMFDGATFAIGAAQQAMQNKQTAEKGAAISRAISIVTDGLQASLDLGTGGEIAERLNALYEYIATRLLYANLKNDAAALDEAGRLIKELRGAWAEIANDPAVLSPTKDAA